MPTVLSICRDPSLCETRRLLLTGHGYNVVVINDFRQIGKISSHPNCVVIGTDIEPKMKRAASSLLEKKWAGVPILEINVLHPEIGGAAFVTSDSPEEVLAALKDLLLPAGRRYTEQLYRRNEGIRERAMNAVLQAKEILVSTREQKARLRRLRRKPDDVD